MRVVFTVGKSCKLFFLGLAVVALPAVASARVIGTDDFETASHPTGDRTITAGGTNGIPFYTRNATSVTNSVAIIADPVGSNALRQADTTTSAVGNAVVGVLSENVSLVNPGDFITLSFRFRYTNVSSATANSAGFRFGLHSSTGSPVTGDGQTTTSDNDLGYYAVTGAGSATAPPTGNQLYVENGGTAPILGGTDRGVVTASSAGVTINDNNYHTVLFTITRTNATTVGLSLSYDAATAITGSTTTLRTTFDEIDFGDGFVANPIQFNIDDVSVTGVPEPGTMSLITIGGGLLALKRSRRPRAIA